MELTLFGESLFDALERFDESLLPLGLYSSEEQQHGPKKLWRYQEWEGALVPHFKAHGCRIGKMHGRDAHSYRAQVQLPGGDKVALDVVKHSGIKVRHYGSAYHVDKHESRAARWGQTDLSGHISALWKHMSLETWNCRARVLLFIGFDKAARPLERELELLQHDLRWSEKNVHFLTRTWPDKAARGFGVRLAAWVRFVPEGE
jgi:hypothetical protein